MLGYVDAIVQRQDKGNMLKKMESFQIEAAARGAFSDLVGHFNKLEREKSDRLERVEAIVKKMSKEQTDTSTQIKKLNTMGENIPKIMVEMKKLDAEVN